jgi:hypothetical protein
MHLHCEIKAAAPAFTHVLLGLSVGSFNFITKSECGVLPLIESDLKRGQS